MVHNKLLKPKLSIAAQVNAMKKLFPNFSLTWKGKVAVWIGEILPTTLSQSYKVKVTYALGLPPNCYVLSPKLCRRDNKQRIPHTYTKNRLCLYLPNSGEWTPQMLIADTIIPWASLWLFYYEIWQAIGEWLGGGKHPELQSSQKKLGFITRYKQLFS